jgi:hypothetical protein
MMTTTSIFGWTVADDLRSYEPRPVYRHPLPHREALLVNARKRPQPLGRDRSLLYSVIGCALDWRLGHAANALTLSLRRKPARALRFSGIALTVAAKISLAYRSAQGVLLPKSLVPLSRKIYLGETAFPLSLGLPCWLERWDFLRRAQGDHTSPA